MAVSTFLLWAVIAGGLYVTNRDVCSPAKIVHAYALVFFLGFYFSTDTELVRLSYLIILMLIACMGCFEALSLRGHRVGSDCRRSSHLAQADLGTITFALWLLSALPLFAQVYLIEYFGGFAAYLANLAFRVRSFAGLGPVIAVIKILPVISVVYFCALITAERVSRTHVMLFIIHLILTVVVGGLSGSRSLVLMNFFWMAIAWNVLRRPISARGIVLLGTALVAVGFLLGTVRDVVSYTGLSTGNFGETPFSEVVSSTVGRIGESGTANTGLDGMRLVFENGVREPQYGLTFLTGLTNLIPRNIWPDKPRSGGLVLTQEYAGDAWGGYSNLSTGAITESMMNFGIVPGFVLGVFLLFALFVMVNHMYRHVSIPTNLHSPLERITSVVRYIFVLQFGAGMLLGEFTNSLVNLLLQLCILVGVSVFVEVVSNHRPLQPSPADSQ